MLGKIRQSIPLILVLLLASLLRLYHLTSLPISLFADEIDVGYQAWSLATTGRDYMGHLLPTYIQSLTEYRAPLLMYVVAPFTALLGATPLAVRLPIALLGILNIYQIYLLTNLLFPLTTNYKLLTTNSQQPATKSNLNLGLLAALLLSVTPWHIHYSRVAFESTLLLTLLMWGTIWFLKYTKKTTLPYSLFPIPYILAFYTYSTANLFVPLFGISLLLIFPSTINNSIRLLQKSYKHIFILLLPLFLILPIAINIVSGPAANRFKSISIFSDPTIVNEIITIRTQPWSGNFERFFHLKPAAYTVTFVKQYLQAYSPQFLFLSGDPFFRHGVGEYGQLLLVTFPFLIIGASLAISSWFNQKQSGYLVVFAWLLIAPISSALTIGGGTHATRLILILPPLIILTAIGFEVIFNSLSLVFKYLVGLSMVGLLTVNVLGFGHYYQGHYRQLSASLWHYGYQQLFNSLAPYLSDTSRHIYINDTYQPSLLPFLFYTKTPPSRFQKTFHDNIAFTASPLFKGFVYSDQISFGEVQFGRLKDPQRLRDLLEPGDIYVAVQLIEVEGDWDWSKNPPSGLKAIETVRNVFGQPQFYLLEETSL